MDESIAMRGDYAIEIRDLSGKLLDTIYVKNMLTNVSRDIRTQMLLGTYTGGNDALHIKYFAFGIGGTPAAATNTRLSNEVYRKQVTQLGAVSDGVVRSVVSLGSAECNRTIYEIGVFCGSSATSAANSGTLLSRVVVRIEKNSNITLNIIRTDTCLI